MPGLCIVPARALADDALRERDLRALLAVGRFTARDGSGVWASNQTLAEVAGMDERHLRRSLARLEAMGYLVRQRRYHPERGTLTSVMSVVLDDPVIDESQQGGGGGQHPRGEGQISPPGGRAKLAPRGRAESARGGRAKLAHQTTPVNETPYSTTARARENSDRAVQPAASDLGLSDADLAELDWLDEPAEPEVQPEVPAAAVLRAPPELTEPVHRAAWEGIVRSAPAPIAVAASIGALASGLHGPGGKAVPWPVLGQALLELQAAAVPFSPAALRAFARRLEAPDPPPRVATPRYGLPAIGPREETWDEVEARYKRQWAAEDAAAAAREAAQNVAQAADSPGGHRSPSLPAERAPAATPAPALTGLVGAVARAFAIPVAPGVRHVA